MVTSLFPIPGPQALVHGCQHQQLQACPAAKCGLKVATPKFNGRWAFSPFIKKEYIVSWGLVIGCHWVGGLYLYM